MKNIFKISLLAALFVASTAQARGLGVIKCLGTLFLGYSTYDIGCMATSLPYRLMRKTEAQVLNVYIKGAEGAYGFLPSLQAASIELKLDMANRINKAIEKAKQEQE